ncbi:hypothetical protein [Streptomyces sp. NPDC055140]
MTDASDAYSFPPDLLAAQKLAAELYADLRSFVKRPTLPWSVEPLDGWEEPETPHGGKLRGYVSSRPASPGWSDDEGAEYAKLRHELAEAAGLVYSHPHWAEYEGAALVSARMTLKHHPEALPTVPGESDGAAPRQEDLAATA